MPGTRKFPISASPAGSEISNFRPCARPNLWWSSGLIPRRFCPRVLRTKGDEALVDLPDLHHLAAPGAEITIRAVPRAGRNRISERDGILRVEVTVVPENGKANAAVAALLATALGVPKSRLTLLRGATSRDKTFRIA